MDIAAICSRWVQRMRVDLAFGQKGLQVELPEGFRYRFLEGLDGFLAKWGVGWVAAWLGSPVLGHWFERVKIAGVYLIPALVGAFAGAFGITAFWKALAKARSRKLSYCVCVPPWVSSPDTGQGNVGM